MAAPAAGIDEVTERVAAQMQKIVTTRIQQDKLTLPVIPAVALKCINLLQRPDFSLREAAQLIEQDPLLASKIIRIANSAALATREPAQTVHTAVTKMGSQRLRTALLEASAQKVFESKDRRISETFRRMWQHALAVGAMARDTVGTLKAAEADMGYLAGLLHDVGKPIVAAMLLEAEKSIHDRRPSASWIGSDSWLAVVQSIHRPVGALFAEKWSLPGAVQEGIRDCADYDNSDRLSIGNAVRFANALAKKHDMYVGAFDAEDVDALITIGRSLLNVEEPAMLKMVQATRTYLDASA